MTIHPDIQHGQPNAPDRQHSMRQWLPTFGLERDENGIVRDPDYEGSVIPQHRLRVYGGRGSVNGS